MPKKKAARPEMCWIESRKCWCKRVSLEGQQHTIEGKTQEIVREKLEDLKRQLDTGMVLGDETTLAEFCKEWYPVKVAGLRHASMEMYANAINTHILPFFKNMKLSDIRPLHVQKLLAQKSDMSHSSLSKILNTLSPIMDTASKNGLINRNPCRGIKAGGNRTKEKKPLSREQQRELCSAVKGTRAELFVLLCLYAGLRREEALGLTWSDVYLDSPLYRRATHCNIFRQRKSNIFR